MVLLSKLLFFASIPCNVLGRILPSPEPIDSEYEEVKRSITNDLAICNSDSVKIQFLIRKLAEERIMKIKDIARIANRYAVKHCAAEQMQNDAKRAQEDAQAVFRAGITRQALENLERVAYPRDLYNNDDLNRQNKWLLALTLYKTEVLDKIRNYLKKNHLTVEQFACAAEEIHSLISNKFAHPKLDFYSLPQEDDEISSFCSFLDMVIARPSEGSLSQAEDDEVVYSNKRAAHLACYSALKFRTTSYLPYENDDNCDPPSTDWYSATIVVQDVRADEFKQIESCLDEIMSNPEFKGKVLKAAVKVMPVSTGDRKDPRTARRHGDSDIAFQLFCKSSSQKEDNVRKKIQEKLGKRSNKPVASIVTYIKNVLNVPSICYPSTTRRTKLAGTNQQKFRNNQHNVTPSKREEKNQSGNGLNTDEDENGSSGNDQEEEKERSPDDQRQSLSEIEETSEAGELVDIDVNADEI